MFVISNTFTEGLLVVHQHFVGSGRSVEEDILRVKDLFGIITITMIILLPWISSVTVDSVLLHIEIDLSGYQPVVLASVFINIFK